MKVNEYLDSLHTTLDLKLARQEIEKEIKEVMIEYKLAGMKNKPTKKIEERLEWLIASLMHISYRIGQLHE